MLDLRYWHAATEAPKGCVRVESGSIVRRTKPAEATFPEAFSADDPWRTSSPIRPGVGFRYTQVAIRASVSALLLASVGLSVD